MASEQEEGERAIFAAFAAVCPLPIDLATVESRHPPEPDVRCRVGDQGIVAFELGEVISRALEQQTSERVAVRRQFRVAYEALSAEDRARVETWLGGAPEVFVGFPGGVTPGKWRRAVKPIIDALVEESRRTDVPERLREGELPLWQIPALQNVVTEVRVRASSDEKVFFGVLEVAEVVDPTRHLLQRKFSKRYATAAPIELLAYYVGAPPPDDPRWPLIVSDVIRDGLQASPFRRVWLFDGFRRRIILVYPELAPSGAGETA